jgi:hypothetical protein
LSDSDGAGGTWSLVRYAAGSLAHAIYLRRQKTSMSALRSDLAYSARSLLRHPTVGVLGAVTLAMGIGAAAVVFSLAEAVLLRPFAFEEADRLVRI